MKRVPKVVVASMNPVKLKVVQVGFSQMFRGSPFTFTQVNARSGVAKQPLSDKETLQGALNRIRHAQKISPNADFYVGLEGGVEDVNGELREFAWIVVQGPEDVVGKAKAATFVAPPIFRHMVLREGKEIGDVCDIVFGEKNSKQNMGATGLLTNNAIDREEYYRHAVVLALVPFRHPELYDDSES